MRRSTRLALLTLTLLGGVPASAEARPLRPEQIPNGGKLGCLNCHGTAGGGDLRNAFGHEVENGFLADDATVVWGPELAHLDSDRDGRTNGQELRDPAGAWRPREPQPGALDLVTNPGVVDAPPSVPALRGHALPVLVLGLTAALALTLARCNQP